MASQVVIHAMALEIARGVSSAMENRAMRDAVDDLVEVPVEGMEEEDETGLLQLAHVKTEESAFMQVLQAGGLGGVAGGVRRRSGKLVWRPHKAAHVSTRRRTLQGRERSLSMDVAEWAALAGPQRQDAIFATKRVAEELRNVISAPALPVGEVGLCRSDSNRLQGLLREWGDAGALILLRASSKSYHSLSWMCAMWSTYTFYIVRRRYEAWAPHHRGRGQRIQRAQSTLRPGQ